VNKTSAIAEMAAQCCTNQIFAVRWGYLSLTQSFSVTYANIVMSNTQPKTRFF